jgi:hypothetical protein
VARKTFFSFHYERDNWRAGQVRNCWLTQGDEAGYIDGVDWEAVKSKGDAAIKKWIDDQLYGTTVTVVLIGAETSTREYVRYEIKQSIARPNGLLGIYIHNIKNQYQQTDYEGSNPLPYGYPTYDWVYGDGRANLGSWIEAAARKAGK